LKKGKLVEEGTHRELIAKDGVYASAYRKQAEGYKE
jgi:ABC-type multidrug transport system fused ATPase/permease subunit